MSRWVDSDLVSETGDMSFIVVENDRSPDGLGLGRLCGLRSEELKVCFPEVDTIEMGLQRTWFGFKTNGGLNARPE